MKTGIMKPLTAAILATSLTGCLSSGSSSEGTGSLSLDITDAPVDSLEKVVITFDAITLKPRSGGQIRIDLEEAQTLDMLELSRGNSASLLSDEEVPAGDYNWIRLHLDESDMHVIDKDGGRHDLTVPSGILRLVSGFTVPEGGHASFTIDLDVRKAIVKPTARDYKLRPALRLVDNAAVGAVEGDVFQEVWDEACEDVNDFAGLVYVYEGDVEPVDFNMNREEDELQPLMAANVEMAQGDSQYNYKAAFLTEGEYTIAYTCDRDDMDTDSDLSFHGTRNINIVADTTIREDFGTIQTMEE